MAVTTGVINGNIVGVKQDGVLVACSTGATFNGTNEEIETTCKDNDGAKTTIPGIQTWTITINGNTKNDNTVLNIRAFLELWKSKATSTFTFGTSNSDDPYLEGDGFVSAFTWEGPLNAPSTWSATISPRSEMLLFNT